METVLSEPDERTAVSVLSEQDVRTAVSVLSEPDERTAVSVLSEQDVRTAVSVLSEPDERTAVSVLSEPDVPRAVSVRSEPDVRTAVSECLRTVATAADNVFRITALQNLNAFLADGPESPTRCARSAEFRKCHYSRTLQFLVSNIGADWLLGLTAAQRTELWDGLFLRGPPEQALLALMDGIATVSPSAGLEHLADVLEAFLLGGRLGHLLWSYSGGPGERLGDSPQLREALVGRVAALPELAANSLRHGNRALFLPQQYCPLLAEAVLYALEETCRALREGKDCSLIFVAQTLGKVCIQGHGGLVLAVLGPRLSVCTLSDLLWRRVSRELLEKVPQRCLEGLLTRLVGAVPGPKALGRIMGNLVLKSKTAEFVLCHKLLLLHYHLETKVLRSLLGYLAGERERRVLLVQVVVLLAQAWASPGSVRHTCVEQQAYVSRALLLSVGLLQEEELLEMRPELLQCMLGGMQTHLDSGVEQVRRLGMVVGECISSRIDTGDAKLSFEYEPDLQTQELLSLLSPVEDEEQLEGITSCQETGSVTSPTQEVPPPATPQHQRATPESDLDSDDDLPPYDMSGDQELERSKPPRYLRDCLEALTCSEDGVRVELSLRAAEGLIRSHVSTATEVGVQMTKVLLHMEDKFNIAGFLLLRQGAMVALVVVSCIPVTRYLTTEFYSMNYSLRQRLDILEVLAMAAQELSQPISRPQASLKDTGLVTEVTPCGGRDLEHWRQVVERRIQSNTKYISKGATRPPAVAAPNRFAPLAGHFFFPLLKSYDRPQVTFDLLGSDHLVLGRLLHTLALLTHLAVNAPVAVQMCRALLDFVWVLRYHVDQMVRRGVLFAVCSVFLSMPRQSLLLELGDQLLETRAWLADVAEGDPDNDCRSLAVQSLVLLDKSLKQHLDPQAQSLQS